MENKNTFGSFLKEKRVEKNLTQKELSKLLFVSESDTIYCLLILA